MSATTTTTPRFFSGRDGSLIMGNSASGTDKAEELVKVVSWSFSASLDLLDTTSLGDTSKSYSPGREGYTGSASLRYYRNSSGKFDAGKLLKKLIRTDTATVDPSTVFLRLRLSDDSSAPLYGNATTKARDIGFNAYITSAQFGVGSGDIATAEIGFQVTGALSYAAVL